MLGGQARREEELRTEHLPNLDTTGYPGQLRPHVGPLSAFSSVSGLVLHFPPGPQRGGPRFCQGKGKHYKEALRGPLTTQLWGPDSVHPSYDQRVLTALPQDTTEVPHLFLSQELQEPGGEGRSLRPVSWGQRAEEVQAMPGVKVSRVP